MSIHEPSLNDIMEIDILQQELGQLRAGWTVGNYFQYKERIDAIQYRICQLRYGNQKPFKRRCYDKDKDD